MRFPQTEPEIAALALVMVQRLAQAGDEFPAPPVAVRGEGRAAARAGRGHED